MTDTQCLFVTMMGSELLSYTHLLSKIQRVSIDVWNSGTLRIRFMGKEMERFPGLRSFQTRGGATTNKPVDGRLVWSMEFLCWPGARCGNQSLLLGNKKVHNPIPLQRFQSAISPGLRGKSTKKLLAAPGESNDGHPGTQAGLSLEYMNTIFIDFCS